MASGIKLLILCASLAFAAPALGAPPAGAPAAGAAVDGAALTLDTALARARVHAPAVRRAQARVDVAAGERSTAALPLGGNPNLTLGAGPRFGSGGADVDFEIGIEQSLGAAGGRRARTAVADAGVDLARAQVADAVRVALQETALTFAHAVHASERLRLAEEAERTETEAHAATERRVRAGDLPPLDAGLAAATAARARADVLAALAARERVLASLRILMGMAPGAPLEPMGSLDVGPALAIARDEAAAPGPQVAPATHRADLQALAADVRTAEAGERLASTGRWDVGVWAQAEREGEDGRVLAGISLDLPMFDRAQGARTSAAAEARAARRALEDGTRVAAVELDGAVRAWRLLAQAAEILGRDAVPVLAEYEAQTGRAWEAGRLPLRERLLARQAAAEARRAWLDARLEARLAAVAIDAAAGLLK